MTAVRGASAMATERDATELLPDAGYRRVFSPVGYVRYRRSN
ncbi:hypothetical protein [Streptomyces sp. NEAU-S77]